MKVFCFFMNLAVVVAGLIIVVTTTSHQHTTADAFRYSAALPPVPAYWIQNTRMNSYYSMMDPSPRLANRNLGHTSAIRTTTTLLLSRNDNEDEDDNNAPAAEDLSGLLDLAGMVTQPVVWTSLYTVATTGSGLPAGPFGLIGALEGLSYLVIVGFAATFIYSRLLNPSSSSTIDPSSIGSKVQTSSFLTVLAGIFVLLKLVGDEGCVPNAKPILDYSAYLPVCNSGHPLGP